MNQKELGGMSYEFLVYLFDWSCLSNSVVWFVEHYVLECWVREVIYETNRFRKIEFLGISFENVMGKFKNITLDVFDTQLVFKQFFVGKF